MKVKTPLFTELRGTVGRPLQEDMATCRTMANKTIILEKKPIPRYGRTPLQDNQRLAWRQGCDTWNGLSYIQKLQWTEEAIEDKITGFNYFMQNFLGTSAEKVYEKWDYPGSQWRTIYSILWRAQTFTVGATSPNVKNILTKIKIYSYRLNQPGIFEIALRAVDGAGKPTGPDLSTGTINGNSITNKATGGAYTFLMEEYELQPSTKYCFCCRAPTGNAADRVHMHVMFVIPAYPGGNTYYSTDSGATWTQDGGAQARFEQHGIKA